MRELSPLQKDFDKCLRNWLNVAYGSLTMAGGRFLGRADWVEGSTLAAYLRFQYKATAHGMRFCIVLANIRSEEPGGTRVVMEALKEFSERTGLVVYIENVLNKRVVHVAEEYAMTCVDHSTAMGLPCYYREF